MELSVFSGDEKQGSTDSNERETLMEDSIHPCSRRKEVDSRLRIRVQERNQVPEVTVLNRNQIIVSATVHMVEWNMLCEGLVCNKLFVRPNICIFI